MLLNVTHWAFNLSQRAYLRERETACVYEGRRGGERERERESHRSRAGRERSCAAVAAVAAAAAASKLRCRRSDAAPTPQLSSAHLSSSQPAQRLIWPGASKGTSRRGDEEEERELSSCSGSRFLSASSLIQLQSDTL